MSKALEAFDMALTYRSPSGRVYIDVGPTREYIIELERRVKELESALRGMDQTAARMTERAEQAEAEAAAEKLNVKIAMTQRDKHRQARERAEWMLNEALVMSDDDWEAETAPVTFTPIGKRGYLAAKYDTSGDPIPEEE